MASQEKGRPLPKFGEWDVNNPASAEGFTVIFNKARDDKKTSTTNVPAVKIKTPQKFENSTPRKADTPKKRWFCCG